LLASVVLTAFLSRSHWSSSRLQLF